MNSEITTPILAWAVLAPGRTTMLTPWSILTATAGLIAFLIGFYTLIGRERKSPYIINSVFPVFLLCLFIAALSVVAALLSDAQQQLALQMSAGLLVITFLYSALIVFRITIRFVYFVDSISFRHLPGIRHLRRLWILLNPTPSYAHNPVNIPDALKEEIEEILGRISDGSWGNRKELDPQALAVAVEHQGQGNGLLAELARAFLKRDFTVQYLTASRHPIEFIGYLKRFLETAGDVWANSSSKIVVIDAFSPHFAFLDSIYAKKDRELKGLSITTVVAKETYAGMHSASSRAFKVFQKRVGHDHRNPTLVIYEDTYALTDLESPEQYRIFLRHVMPSERLWGAMFTVFIESTQPEADWRMLQAYASMKLDLRAGTARAVSNPAASVPNNEKNA